jgi:hypothetical protein
VEACNGIDKHLMHRLVHDGKVVLDEPTKLSAQVRAFATGSSRNPPVGGPNVRDLAPTSSSAGEGTCQRR